MKSTASTLLALILATAAVSAFATASTEGLRFNAVAERKNLVVNIDKAMVASYATPEKLDGLMGVTRDFQGQQMEAFILFNDAVPEEKLMAMAEYQGRIKGTVHCKRVRVGTSPDYPHVKIGALGEDCTIKALNH